MKRAMQGLVAAVLMAVLLFVSGCKHEPNPPTEQDAIAVWNNVHRSPKLVDLVSLKKTNGQMTEINGVKQYVLYYTATQKLVIDDGLHKPGTENSYSGNYPFQWTEKGWLGPDNQVYPEH